MRRGVEVADYHERNRAPGQASPFLVPSAEPGHFVQELLGLFMSGKDVEAEEETFKSSIGT